MSTDLRNRWNQVSWLYLVIGAAMVFATAEVAARTGSVALLRNTGPVNSSLCTKNGIIYVVHTCQGRDAMSYCSFGHTALTGPGTFRLGPGNANVPKGCYNHTLEDSTVVGTAVANSTVWYDPQ